MGWETRRNGKPYYYRKTRHGSHVRSEYIGAGETAALISVLKQSERAEREHQRAVIRRELQAQADLDRRLADMGEIAQLLARAKLLTNGAHTHKGQWRKRKSRMAEVQIETKMQAKDPDTEHAQALARLPEIEAALQAKKQALDPNTATKTLTIPQDTLSSVREYLRHILLATNTENPKREDLDELRKLLEEMPELWKLAGDFYDVAVDAILSHGTKQALMRESAKHGLEVLKMEMGYAQASPLERVLIENVVICRLQFLDTQRKHGLNTNERIIVSSGDYWERRLTMSHNRYMRACETLARVRRLNRPGAVQVNIAGGPQMNIASGPSSNEMAQVAPKPEIKEVKENSLDTAQKANRRTEDQLPGLLDVVADDSVAGNRMAIQSKGNARASVAPLDTNNEESTA